MPELLGQLDQALGTTYRLVRELGGGGMSRVFLAEEVALGRRVVLKALPEELARGLSSERFRREILVAARLHHPHIVPLLAAGEADGLLYYTMPFIEGESLRTRLERQGELPVPEALRILCDVADALAYAHQNGVVHRDIKPGNVLLAGHHALVADFGVAKAVSEAVGHGTLTSVGMTLGTPAYMSPEQASADPHTDHRADIYSLGVLAYQMLAGRLPFTDASTQRLLAAHITQRPEPLASVRPSIPPLLDSVVMRCLEKRPADRWQRAEDLAAALEAAATPSGGTLATPASGRAEGAKAAPAGSSRRLARGVALAAGAAGVVYLGLAATGVLGHRTLVAEGALAARDRVLITDFENRTPDSTLAVAVTEALRVDLTQSPVIKVVSPEQARDALARMRHDTTAALDYALGREVALRDGIKAVVAGDIAAVGGQYVVSARLVSPAKGDVLAAYRATASGPGEIIRAVDRVSKQLRGRIGESLKGVGDAPALETVTTASLDALRSYSQAIRLSGGAEHDRTLTLLEQAVKLDSTFASAWRAMGITLSNWGDDPQRMTEAFTRAYRLRDRLTPRERYSAEAAYFAYVDPRPNRVVAAYEAMLDLNPDDFTALNNLGIQYYLRGNDARALSYYRRAAAAVPSPIAFGNLIDAQSALGDLPGVDSTMAFWRARFPGDPFYGRYAIDLAAGEGRYDSARALAQAFVAQNRESRSWRRAGNEVLAAIARVQGRLQESERFADAAEDAAAGPDSAALATLGKAMTRVSSDVIYRGRSARAADPLRALLAAGVLDRIAPLNRPYGELAFTFAHAGRPDLARDMMAQQERVLTGAGEAGRLAMMQRRADPYNRGVAGVVQAAEGKPAEAAVALRALDAEVGHVWVLPELGRAYDAAGQTDSALAVYQRYLSQRMTDRIGLDSWYLPRVLFRLGELYEARGDRIRAAQYYGRFVRLWSGADAGLQPRIADAKRRLAALMAETS
jgi:serine/threonine-protein kinase